MYVSNDMKFNVGWGVGYHSLRGLKTVGMVGWGHIIKGLVNRLRRLDLSEKQYFSKTFNQLSVSHSKLGDIKEMADWLEPLCSKERLH